MKTIYADTREDLIIEMISYFHDHCWHFYSGKTENVPEHLKEYVAENHPYIFIYEEDEPVNNHET